MNDLLRSFLQKFVAVFFDDILVYSSSFPTHLDHLEAVFSTLLKGSFFLRRSKCIITEQCLNYLGHIISLQGVAPDSEKIQAMTQWPIPMSTFDLQSFLVLTGFYRKFIKNYATTVVPLTILLCKDKFSWSPEAQATFQQLKYLMTQAPILATSDFTVPFTLETDASGTTIEAVLLQQS